MTTIPTETGYKSDRAIFEAEVLRIYNNVRSAGTAPTQAYQNTTNIFNSTHKGRSIGWWQVYYVIAKARKSGKEVL